MPGRGRYMVNKIFELFFDVSTGLTYSLILNHLCSFSPERKETIEAMAYHPFGTGQRSCPAMRFAEMELKIVIAKIVTTHLILLDKKHKVYKHILRC